MSTTPTTEHTPTPWKAELARTLIHITGYHRVCEISISTGHFPRDPLLSKPDYVARQKANAAFIVRAVNAHEANEHKIAALVKALEAAEKALVNHANSENMAWVSPLMTTMKAALALASGDAT